METKYQLAENITLHTIHAEQFKTNVISVFLTTELKKENVTKEALLPAVLRLGTQSMTTQQKINKALESLYGAAFNCGVEKRGDNHVLKFYLETIQDEYTLDHETIFKQLLQFMFEIILNPVLENGHFKEEFVKREKENLRKIIEGRIDNKTNYAYSRCIEEMFKNQAYGTYEYGYVEDLEKIHAKDLYEFYLEFLKHCKIDIFVSGNIKQESDLKELIEKELFGSGLPLEGRKVSFVKNSINDTPKDLQEKIIKENMEITQGKLVIGLCVQNQGNKVAETSVYNAILGGGANSKLFQNVREKASLAYTAGSGYLKTKNVILIRCGIEIENYEAAIQIIKQQLEDMKNGEFDENDMKNAKELIMASIRSTKDEQTSEISYNFSQELSEYPIELDKFEEKVKEISREEILTIAKSVQIDTIYFLQK